MIEFSIAQLQVALFLTSIDLSKRLKLAVAIQEASEGFFDADPLMLPLPPDAPVEIPRIRLSSSDENWAFQVAGERLDCFYKPHREKRETTEKFEDVIGVHTRICSSIWKMLQEEFSASGERIGVISTFVASSEGSVQVLREKFISSSNAPEPHELRLHALHKMSLKNIAINRWTRCNAVNLPMEQKAGDALQLQIDINTLTEQSFDLTQDSIQIFITGAKDLTLETVASLFDGSNSEQKVF